MDFEKERYIMNKTDDIVLLSIATFTLFPIYYLLQVVSVHRAVYKLITAPYKWEKTAHIAEED